MFALLRGILGRKDPLRKAGRHCAGDGFVRAIVATNVFVIGAIEEDGLDPATMTQEDLLASIERSAAALSERETFAPLMYERDGATCLPFFSSQKHCQRFCGEYAKRRNRVFGFHSFEVQGTAIAGCASAADVLILNAETSDERPLSAFEKRLLEAMPREGLAPAQ